MSKPSAAVLCIGRNEQPFIAEWLEYHFSLGFDHVYFVSTDADFGKVSKFFDGFKNISNISVHHFDEFNLGWQMGCYNTFFPKVKEDWLLIVDIDEYLYLNCYPDVQSFLGTVGNEIGQIQFPWLNLISTSYFHQRTHDILRSSQMHASDHVKSMVRRNNVTGLGIHSHGIRDSKTALSSGSEISVQNKHELFMQDTDYYRCNPFILHFLSRGHFDVLNRIIDHQFFNTKCGEHERRRLGAYLIAEPNWENLPTRYLLMKFLRILPVVDIDIVMPKLESHTDVRSLQEIFLNNMNAIVEFDCHDPTMIDEKFEERFLLKHKLSQMDITEECDLEDYLGCGSQLEYIGRLREKLIPE